MKHDFLWTYGAFLETSLPKQNLLGTTVLPSRLNQSNFFDILLPLAKWNMIICLLRTFLENALKKQNFPFSPLSLHCACMSVGNYVFFFFKLATPMHVLFFKVARSPFKQKYGTLDGFELCCIQAIECGQLDEWH